VNLADGGLLLVAGVLAGLAGAGAGLASLISYPALLLVGLPPVAANVTNTVAITLNGAGAIVSSRPELEDQSWRLRRFGVMALLGGAAGSALLLTTPASAFERVVPVLIALASIALLARPWLRGRRAEHVNDRNPAVAAAVGVIAIYGGYFGAAAGVMLLAMLGAVMSDSVPRINALKNVLLLCANLIAALAFIVFGPVHWLSALPLAAGFFVGGLIAPVVVRRLPEAGLRIAIGVAGLALAFKLGLDAYGAA
jgi:uncharacterized membrane protein YfcA